jgi:two-component system NtrC family sensor kinase
MMRATLIFLFCAAVLKSHAQEKTIDSLRQIINQNKNDEAQVNALAKLGRTVSNFSDAINYTKDGLLLSKKINYKKGEADCNLVLAERFSSNAQTTEAIYYGLNALQIYEKLKDNMGIASAHLLLQGDYRAAEDFTNALLHEFEGEKIAEQNNVIGVFNFPNHRLAPLFLAETAQTYILKNEPDSAIIYAQKSIQQNELFDGTSWEFPIYLLATIQQIKGDYVHSLENYRLALRLSKIQTEDAQDSIQIYSGMSTLFKSTGQLDSSIYYAQIVNKSWNPVISEAKNLLEAVNNLYEVYKLKGKQDSALKYLELNYRLRTSFFNTEKQKQIQEATFSSQLKQQEIITEQGKYRNRLQALIFTIGIFALLIISTLLIRNNRHNKKAKIKIEKAYSELKSAQSQLIQSEKMASLGELTAGIAHEIQNPLNFVNNFSEVNREMLAELNDEIDKGNYDDAKSIAKDVIANEGKITHHGKRADAIVKGMLLHSRSSTGVKEPTDINALADEYLRLSYHGMRAKDKTFNAEIKTYFDNSLGKINIVPQDIGRVLLNLYNNAFYAVNEKAKDRQPLKGSKEYLPTVTVSTKPVKFPSGGLGVELTVKDNGNGIPQKVVDKIFQPFFTTKPTGEGTGLGLSLSYDIIKAHGGEIKVETKEGEGSEFIIMLPFV